METPTHTAPPVARPSWFKGDAGCDWHEDAGHENGSYYCKCLSCDADFIGHKRRHICRKCHYEAKAQYDALTLEERAAFDEKRNAEIRDYFSRKNNTMKLTQKAKELIARVESQKNRLRQAQAPITSIIPASRKPAPQMKKAPADLNRRKYSNWGGVDTFRFSGEKKQRQPLSDFDL